MGSFRTVAGEASTELKVEKSRFLGYATPTPDAATAQAVVARLRQKHREASHVCFAYRVGDGPAALIYFTDHGEPAGTAGKPILGAILRRDLTDVAVVVVRYFGGRKLGVRGLIEAYGEAASAALTAAGVVVRQRLGSLRVACAYASLPAVTRLVRQAGGEVGPPQYDPDRVTVAVRAPEEALPGLRTSLAVLPATVEG